jgi:hypothetical protein
LRVIRRRGQPISRRCGSTPPPLTPPVAPPLQIERSAGRFSPAADAVASFFCGNAGLDFILSYLSSGVGSPGFARPLSGRIPRPRFCASLGIGAARCRSGLKKRSRAGGAKSQTRASHPAKTASSRAARNTPARTRKDVGRCRGLGEIAPAVILKPRSPVDAAWGQRQALQRSRALADRRHSSNALAFLVSTRLGLHVSAPRNQ